MESADLGPGHVPQLHSLPTSFLGLPFVKVPLLTFHLVSLRLQEHFLHDFTRFKNSHPSTADVFFRILPL